LFFARAQFSELLEQVQQFLVLLEQSGTREKNSIKGNVRRQIYYTP
jgi:hypothetical protein